MPSAVSSGCIGLWCMKPLTHSGTQRLSCQTTKVSLQGPREALKRAIFDPGTYLVPKEDGLVVIGATSERQAVSRKGSPLIGRNSCKQDWSRIYQQRQVGLR